MGAAYQILLVLLVQSLVRNKEHERVQLYCTSGILHSKNFDWQKNVTSCYLCEGERNAAEKSCYPVKPELANDKKVSEYTRQFVKTIYDTEEGTTLYERIENHRFKYNTYGKHQFLAPFDFFVLNVEKLKKIFLLHAISVLVSAFKALLAGHYNHEYNIREENYKMLVLLMSFALKDIFTKLN